jgi:hypothetical protein
MGRADWEECGVPTSTAIVATDAARRYAKQLLAHLGRKTTVEEIDGEPDGGRLVFAYGSATLRPAADHLLLDAFATDMESLARVEDVLGRHLERFGARNELVVTWRRAGTDGTDG